VPDETPRVHIPSHLSEATFRTYEPHIALAVKQWPDETSFHESVFVAANGQKLSPNTFVARFRDAFTSLRRFHWPTTVIDLDKLAAMAGKFAVTLDSKGVVWVRNKTKQGRPPEFVAEGARLHPELGAKAVREVWHGWTPEEVEALCLLIDKQRFTGTFVLDGVVDEMLVNTLESKYNISFTPDTTKNQTIVL